MVEIAVSKEDIDKAREISKQLGVLNNSFTSGQGNLYGIVGEIVCKKFLKCRSKSNTKDYDFVYKGKKIEVKSKRCSGEPKDNYLCSVASTSMHQKCDYYIFLRVSVHLDIVWILGYISKENFVKNSIFKKKGDKDGKKFFFKADCHNIKISELGDITKFKKHVEKENLEATSNKKVRKRRRTSAKISVAKRDGNPKAASRKIPKD